MEFPLPNNSVSAYGYPLNKIAPRALVVGDPNRATIGASLLQSADLIWDVRGYRAYTGFFGEKKVTICSHGVGAPSAALILTDLFKAGVLTIIRAGTCGSLSPQINIGDLIIASGAIREDGASDQLLPAEFPAVASYDLTKALLHFGTDLCEKQIYEGVVWSSSLYYPHSFIQSNIDIWRKCGVLACEMEMAVLFTLAAIYGAKAGGILAVEAEVVTSEAPNDPTNPQTLKQTQTKMLQIALNALTQF